MSEQNIGNTRFKIEDDFEAGLSGELLNNALDYTAHLKANGILPVTPDSNAFGSADGHVCVIAVYPVDNIPGWTIFIGSYDSVLLRGEYQNFPIDEKLKEFAWAHVHTCSNFTSNGKECGCGFHPGRRITIFGKEFNHVCTAVLCFRNPDGEALELAKRLTDVWKRINADAAKKDKPYVLKENEWPSVKDIGAHTGRPLGKAYCKSLDVQFRVTPRRGIVDAAVGFSGGGWVPATWRQFPIALRVCGSPWIEAYKGPTEGWTFVEGLKRLENMTYFVEMSINVADNVYNATVSALDANGGRDAPRRIAKDFPFSFGNPAITAIDTIYLWHQDDDNISTPTYVVRDFRIIGGE